MGSARGKVRITAACTPEEGKQVEDANIAWSAASHVGRQRPELG